MRNQVLSLDERDSFGFGLLGRRRPFVRVSPPIFVDTDASVQGQSPLDLLEVGVARPRHVVPVALDLVECPDFGAAHGGVDVAHGAVGRLDGVRDLLLEVFNVTDVSVDQQLLGLRVAIVRICTKQKCTQPNKNAC